MRSYSRMLCHSSNHYDCNRGRYMAAFTNTVKEVFYEKIFTGAEKSKSKGYAQIFGCFVIL